MLSTPIRFGGDGSDSAPDFVHAISLLASLEGAVGMVGHSDALPYLGMARAELVDLGQHQPTTHYIAVDVVDFRASMIELEDRLTAMVEKSTSLTQSLRIDAARRLLRRGLAAAG